MIRLKFPNDLNYEITDNASDLIFNTYTAQTRPRPVVFGEQDPTTRRMLEEILASEEAHADDLSSLLDGLAAGD